MSRPDTWMPVYWGDYARDTGHLNAAGHGAYLMLIKHYWCTGKPLADDDNELWRIACCDSKKEWLRLRPQIIRFFSESDGLLRHKRVDVEVAKAFSSITAKAEAGKLGAERRWQKDRSAIADPSVRHRQNDAPSPSPSPSSEEKKETTLRVVKAQAPKGTRLPADWTPGKEGVDFAKGLGLSPRAVFDVFKDYWLAKAGADAVKVDWQATWKNWCRRDAERTGAKPPSKADLLNPPQSSFTSTVSNGF